MPNSNQTIQVFEYSSLQYGVEYTKVLFKESYFNALVKLNELHKNKYFTVGYKKIIFKERSFFILVTLKDRI